MSLDFAVDGINETHAALLERGAMEAEMRHG
jgi:hypothetical protein